MRYNVRNPERVQSAAERARYMAAQMPDCDEAVLVAALDELQEQLRVCEDKMIGELYESVMSMRRRRSGLPDDIENRR